MPFRRLAAVLSLALLFSASAQAQTALQPGGLGTAPAPLQVPAIPVITNVPAPAAPAGQRPVQPQQPPAVLVPAQPLAAPPLAEPRPEERNEFQDFIAASTGRPLPIFGQALFRDVPSTFAPVENIPVTPDYVIGPGDELYIRAWGQIDVDYRATVDRSGTISIPRVGVINVAGIKYQDIGGYVKNAVGRVFRGFELTVTMGQLRSVQIFVVGQARRPGSYTVSSLSTLVNAVFAAGGPSSRGSMRSIQLKRGAKTVAELDLYDLLVYGDKSKDVPLLPGDVIHIAPIGPLAAVAGSVNAPAIYELKGATTLEKLIEWSGGLATTAQTRTATLERIDARSRRVVDKFSLDRAALARPLQDGDLVTVLQVAPRFENAVTLRGNVAVPLRHPYTEGMRVRDLIPDKDALISYDYYRRQNRAIQTEFLEQALRGGEAASVGTVEKKEDVRRLERRVSPEKLYAEINWDYAVIERLNETDFSTSLVPFNLGKAILEADPAHNLALRRGDIVTIFSREDISVPVARRTKLVRLEGEFNYSGVYQAQPGETLRQLIVRAGGTAPGAYVFGTEFTRESVRLGQERSYQDTLNRIERDLQAQAAERARSALTPEEADTLKIAVASQQSTVARLRALKPTGRVVLELHEDAKLADLPDLLLEDGDRVFIPARPAMVSVFGSVFTEGSFLHRPGRSISDYLTLAGGTTVRADTSQIFVLRADGSASGQGGSIFGFGGGRNRGILPGDTIVVPEDYDRRTWAKTLKDWTQIIYQFGLGAAALKVIKD